MTLAERPSSVAPRAHVLRVATPIGALELTSDGDVLTAARFVEAGELGPLGGPSATEPGLTRLGAPEALRRAAGALGAYFRGESLLPDLALAPASSPFEREVRRGVLRIPPGETATYGALARSIGRPTASRAVGGANARNPLALFVPCHRVVGSGGELTGYAWGLDRKRWLLEHERTLRARSVPQSLQTPSSASQ